MIKQGLILLGAGGHCQSVIDVVESTGLFTIAGILDVSEKVGLNILGYEIIGTNEDIPRLVKEGHKFLITVGQIKTAAIRKRLFEEVKRAGGELAIVIAKTALISKHAVLGEGSIAMHQTLINAGANIGRNTILNSKSIVEHGSVIGDHCHISTAAIVNGDSSIGNEVFVGSNATIFQGIRIGDGILVGAGAIIKENISKRGSSK